MKYLFFLLGYSEGEHCHSSVFYWASSPAGLSCDEATTKHRPGCKNLKSLFLLALGQGLRDDWVKIEFLTFQDPLLVFLYLIQISRITKLLNSILCSGVDSSDEDLPGFFRNSWCTTAGDSIQVLHSHYNLLT